MKISTIITVYNLEKYIENSLCSVFNQMRPPDEVIVVDDCSTDSSPKLLEQYRDKIKYFRLSQNSGVLAAFIKGIEESSGDILSFLDGDDVWHPQKLEQVEKAFLADERRILVTHDYECIDGEGNLRQYPSDGTHLNTARIVKEAGGDLEKMSQLLRNSILSYKGVWLGSAFCIKRKCFDLEKFKRDLSTIPNTHLIYQDHPTAAFVLLENKQGKVFFINKVLFQYRIYGFNSSGNTSDLSSALKTLDKSQATLTQTARLVSYHGELIEENKRQRLALTNVKYLKNLYSKNYFQALKLFSILFLNFWSWPEFAKEVKRVIAVFVIGPDAFFKLKSKDLSG